MATPADYSSAGFQEAVAAIVEQKTYNWIFDINASFLLTSGYLVFMMQLGFALVSARYCLIAVKSVLGFLHCHHCISYLPQLGIYMPSV